MNLIGRLWWSIFPSPAFNWNGVGDLDWIQICYPLPELRRPFRALTTEHPHESRTKLAATDEIKNEFDGIVAIVEHTNDSESEVTDRVIF